jgi:hypothetical protein
MAWIYDDLYQAYRNTDTGQFATQADWAEISPMAGLPQIQGQDGLYVDYNGTNIPINADGTQDQVRTHADDSFLNQLIWDYAAPAFMAGAGGLIGGAAAGGTGATVAAADPALAAGAMGGAAGTAGGGLTALEAAGGLGAASAATGATAGATGTLAPATGGAAAVGGTTALSRILQGQGTFEDQLALAGILGATGLGIYGAGQQGDALRDIANQSRQDRAPYLSASQGWLANPQSYMEGPGQAGLDATLRALSAKGGNPIDQPTSLSIATQSAMRDWRDAVTGFGNLGLSGEDSRNQMYAGAAQSQGDQYNALGYGLGELTRPRRSSLSDVLRSLS